MNQSLPIRMGAQSALNLDINAAIAEGKERFIFEHPEDPKRLIKVVKKTDRTQYKRLTINDLMRRFSATSRIRKVIAQYEVHLRLNMEHLFETDYVVPVNHLYGFINTNLGLGCITERVTDDYGKNAPTLKQLASEGRLTDKMLGSLNCFIERFYDEHIPGRDLSPVNFVYGYRHIAAASVVLSPSWVLVDGFGCANRGSLQNWSTRAVHVGLDRSFNRYKVHGLEWDTRSRRYCRA